MFLRDEKIAPDEDSAGNCVELKGGGVGRAGLEKWIFEREKRQSQVMRDDKVYGIIIYNQRSLASVYTIHTALHTWVEWIYI